MNVPGPLAKDQRQQAQPVPGKVFIFPAFLSMFQMPKDLVYGIPRQLREGDGASLFSSCPLTWKKAFPPSRSVHGEAHDHTGAPGCHYQETDPSVSAISEWLCQSVMPLAGVNPTLLLLLLKRAALVQRRDSPLLAAAGCRRGRGGRSRDKRASKQNHVVFKTPFQITVNQSLRTE